MNPEQHVISEVLLAEALSSIGRRMASVHLPIMVLSDFDYTLCNNFQFNSLTNDHQPSVGEELIAIAKTHDLTIATGRRADNPAISWLWESGLISDSQTVIAENGGVFVTHSRAGLETEILIQNDDQESLQDTKTLITENLTRLPTGQKLIFKQGKTFLVVRLQDEKGVIHPDNQSWLAQAIRQLSLEKQLQVVNTRVSVTIQNKNVNKGTAFSKLLARRNVQRSDVFVVGMGDGHNDAEIFAQSDLRLGFSEEVKHLVDIVIPDGASAATQVLTAILRSRR